MDLDEFVVKFCENNSCHTCPVHLNDFERRSKYAKEVLHKPCSDNLLKWIQCEINGGE